MMRARPPPMARRMAISFWRAVPNASIMLARFRHAVSSTAPASPCSTTSAQTARRRWTGWC